MSDIKEIATIRSKTFNQYAVCFDLEDIFNKMVCGQNYTANDNCIDEFYYLYDVLPYPEFFPFNALTFVHEKDK